MKPHHNFQLLALILAFVVPISSFSQECNIALPMNTCSGATCTYRYAYVAESIPVSFSSLPIVDTSAAFPGLCGPPPPIMGIGGIDGAIFSHLWVAITDSGVTNGDMSTYVPEGASSEQKFLVSIPPTKTGLVGASSIRSISAISGTPSAEMTLSGTSTLRFVDALNTPLRYVRWTTSRADACLLAVANDPRTSIDVNGTVTTFNTPSPVGLCSNAVLSQPVVSVCRPDLPYTPGVARFDVPPAASGECFNPCATGATSGIGTYYAPLNQYLLAHNQSATFYPASAPNCASAGVIRTCNGQASLDGTSATLGSLSGPGTHAGPIGSCTSTCTAGTTLNWSQGGNNCSFTTATQGDLGDSSVVNDGDGSYIGSATLSCGAGGWSVSGGTCAPAGSDCWRALCGGFSNMYFSSGSFANAADCESQGLADYCIGGPVSCTFQTNDIACNGSTLCSPGSTSAAGCPVIANGDSRKTCAANGASWSACSSTCDAGYNSIGAQPGIACNAPAGACNTFNSVVQPPFDPFTNGNNGGTLITIPSTGEYTISVNYLSSWDDAAWGQGNSCKMGSARVVRVSDGAILDDYAVGGPTFVAAEPECQTAANSVSRSGVLRWNSNAGEQVRIFLTWNYGSAAPAVSASWGWGKVTTSTATCPAAPVPLCWSMDESDAISYDPARCSAGNVGSCAVAGAWKSGGKCANRATGIFEYVGGSIAHSHSECRPVSEGRCNGVGVAPPACQSSGVVPITTFVPQTAGGCSSYCSAQMPGCAMTGADFDLGGGNASCDCAIAPVNCSPVGSSYTWNGLNWDDYGMPTWTPDSVGNGIASNSAGNSFLGSTITLANNVQGSKGGAGNGPAAVLQCLAPLTSLGSTPMYQIGTQDLGSCCVTGIRNACIMGATVAQTRHCVDMAGTVTSTPMGTMTCVLNEPKGVERMSDGSCRAN